MHPGGADAGAKRFCVAPTLLRGWCRCFCSRLWRWLWRLLLAAAGGGAGRGAAGGGGGGGGLVGGGDGGACAGVLWQPVAPQATARIMTAVGFEPTRIAPPELESGALDRSAKLSHVHQPFVLCRLRHCGFCNRQWDP